MRKIALLLVAAATACGGKFAPAELVRGVRLLAVQGEPPDVPGGMSSTLRALAVDQNGQSVAVTWAACHEQTPPSSGGVIAPDCIENDTAPYLEPLPDGTSTTVTMPTGLPTQLGLPDATGGFYLPIRVRGAASDGSDQAVFRLRDYYTIPCLANPIPPNHNPTIASLSLDDNGTVTPLDPATPHAVHPGDAIHLQAHFTDDSAETYPTFSGNPCMGGATTMQKEMLQLSWFTDGGSLSEHTTGQDKDTQLTVDGNAPPVGGTVHVWVIGRDERGGVDWTERDFPVE